eukprot:scaffold10861_cov180-Amphora_coffeaeformis.AAC.29
MADKSPQKNGKASSKTTKQHKEQPSFEIPTFQLPKDFERNPDRYELWTLRLPTDVPLDALEGVKVNPQTDSVEIESNDKRYQMMWGNSVENESFRLLASSKNVKDDSDDDDSEKSDDEKQTFLYPITRPFTRHINIMESSEKMDERKLAPTQEEAPKAIDPLRIPYVPVAQRTNLRRRWQMPGSGIKNDNVVTKKKSPPPPVAKRKLSGADQTPKKSAAVAVKQEEEEEDAKPPAKRKLSETSITEGNGEGVGDKEAKKAAKRAKKEAKAAKKEAKKEKKAKKSEKKSKDKR